MLPSLRQPCRARVEFIDQSLLRMQGFEKVRVLRPVPKFRIKFRETIGKAKYLRGH